MKTFAMLAIIVLVGVPFSYTVGYVGYHFFQVVRALHWFWSK